MRPLRLELEGFTVYKNRQVIDFGELDFFVIQGKTGAGKTSIVDAITFALYEKVPRYEGDTRSTAAKVLSKGGRSLYVALDFSVGGRSFRIERYYTPSMKSSEVRVMEGGRYLNLKKKEVETWVKDITGLDYATFTKVILLPQGKFDSLLRPSRPEERRKLLINLLNLDVFERVREIASKTFNEMNGKLSVLTSQLSAIRSVSVASVEELERKKKELEEEGRELERRIKEMEERLRIAREREKLEEELKEVRERLGNLEVREEEIRAKKERIRETERLLPYVPYLERLERIEREERDLRLERDKVLREVTLLREKLRNVEAESRKVEAELSEVPRLMEELRRVRERFADLRKALSEAKRLGEMEIELRSLKESIKKSELAYREKEESLRMGFDLRERVKKELESLSFDEEEYEKTLRDVERKKALLEEVKRLEKVERELEEKKRERGKVITELEMRKKELEKKESLSVEALARHIRAHLREGDRCPVCGGTFSKEAEERGEVSDLDIVEEKKRLMGEVLTLERKLSSLQTFISTLEEREEEIHTRLEKERELMERDVEGELWELERKKKKIRELEDTLREHEERLDHLRTEREKALRELERLRTSADSLKKRIEEERERVKALTGGSTALEEIEEKLGALSAEEKDILGKIEEIEERRNRVNSYREELKVSLAEKKARMDELERALLEKEKEKREVQKELGDIGRVKSVLLDRERLETFRKEVESFERDKRALKDRERELSLKIGSFTKSEPSESIEKALSDLRKKKEEVLVNLGNLDREIKETLRKLEEKKSLEKRIEELEREMKVYERIKRDLGGNKLQEFAANLMLSRIVERASEYFLDFTGTYELSLRHDGNLVVSDRVHGGEREVKSLSGGETFLASISLALGVSDVLSANARLESLFIDEGFGSLDEETRERVSDILELVRQKINRMVGIISHVPDIAERFHQKIVVKKHGDFSTVEVIY